MRRIISLLSFVILFALLGLRLAQAQSDEAQGQAAEQAGRFREALKYYHAALQSVSEGSASDQALREKIISLVQKLSPAPAVPGEAERYMARGRAAFKAAKNPSDYEEAVTEFKKAARAAPWLGEAYYNLGVTLDKTGRYEEAIRNLKLYLLASPNAPDAKEIRSLVFEIEYRQERAQREAREKAEEARRQEQARRDAEEQERRRQEQARREAEERQRREAEARNELRQLAGRWRQEVGTGNLYAYIIWEVTVEDETCRIRVVQYIDRNVGEDDRNTLAHNRWRSCSYGSSSKTLTFYGYANENTRLRAVSSTLMIDENAYHPSLREWRRVR